MGELDARIPRGLGKGSIASRGLLEAVLRTVPLRSGAGFGDDGDLERCEERGTSAGADPSQASARQALEPGVEDNSARSAAATTSSRFRWSTASTTRPRHEAFGLADGDGRRDDPLRIARPGPPDVHRPAQARWARPWHATASPSPTASWPASRCKSAEGEQYLGAMAAAANFAWANRHVLAHRGSTLICRGLWDARSTRPEMRLVFDVAHNLAKVETTRVTGRPTPLCVHRKGATRAFGPGHPELPTDLRAVGQPVLMPGVDGNGLVGAVRRRRQSRLCVRGPRRRSDDEPQGCQTSADRAPRCAVTSRPVASRSGRARCKLLSEEAPYAYKDVDEVVEVCHRAGLATKVARLVPLGVVKG